MENNSRASVTGFTLIELMIVVAILGILVSIAYPVYVDQVIRSHRTEAKSALLDAAAREERYYSDNNEYGSLANAGIGALSETGKYNVSISATPAGIQTFTLTATSVRADAICSTLTLTNTGLKNKTGSGSVADCWDR